MQVPALLALVAILTNQGVDATSLSLQKRQDPIPTTSSDQYTACSQCIKSDKLKYCTRKESDGSKSGACCDIKDSKSPQCDDSLDGVYCSDNFGPDVDGADRTKYMVCPQD